MNKNEERNEAGFNWPVVIRNPNARASLDYYYGPYDSVDSMKSSVPNELWVPGFTAAVQSEDGTVEEWWVQGEGAKAGFVKKHELVDGGMRFMGKADSLSQLQAKESPSKGDVWQVAEQDGRHTIYPLYVYDGTEWAPLARNFTLTVKTPDGTSKRYDGSEAVTVDLSGVATRQDVADSKAEAAKTYATIESLDGLATWHDGYFDLLGKHRGTNQVYSRTPNNTWLYTGVTAGKDSITLDGGSITLNGGSVTLDGGNTGLRLTGNEVGLARNGAYYRANPLVLAVRLVDISGPNTTGNTCTIGYLYNPYKLDVTVSDVDSTVGYYKFTHNMYSKGLVTKRKYNENGKQDDMFSYVVMGTARGSDSAKHPLFVATMSCHGDYFTFTTSDDNTLNPFETCNIMIFDFSSL